MKKIFILLSLLISSLNGFSQTNVDSLIVELDKKDVNRVSLLQQVQQLQNSAPGDKDAAVAVFSWIIKNSEQDSLNDIRASAHFAIGRVYTHNSLFAEASFHLTEAQAMAERYGYDIVLAQSLNALGAIYESNMQHDKALDYYKKSLSAAEKGNYKQGISKASYNLGILKYSKLWEKKLNSDPALHLMLTAYRITSSIADTQSIITQATGIADVYSNMKKYDSALFYLRIAGYYVQNSRNERAYINHYKAIARTYDAKSKYDDAIVSYSKGLNLAKKYNTPRWLCQFYDGLASTYEKKGDYKMANYYNQQNIKMHNAMVSHENFAAAADIQNRYERAKKDNEIIKLSAANKQKSLVNKVLIGSLLALVIIGLLGYAYFKKSKQVLQQQKDLQEQKISELEKDKQLLAIDAMLKGQEEERSRIAKELHDGLGGLLSGIRLSLVNMRERLSLSPEGYERFNRPMSMLDNTINDLRKLAHNLMPEALVKYGLHDAIKDFCDSIKATTDINISYQQFGEHRKLSSTATIFIYRIVQELVNNVIKHASATEIMVQFMQSENITNIAVEDNGKGFDKKAIEDQSSGSGMKNIKYRVQYLNGNFDIASSPGHGTSVNIMLKV